MTWGWVCWGRSRSQVVKTKQKWSFILLSLDDVCICTTEPRPRVLGGPNVSSYGDELLDLIGFGHSGTCRGQVQLLGPLNTRLESRLGFKRTGSFCALGVPWHPREAEKGSCASGRIRLHLDRFRRFEVHLNPNNVFVAVCEAKLQPWCNMYLI